MFDTKFIQFYLFNKSEERIYDQIELRLSNIHYSFTVLGQTPS